MIPRLNRLLLRWYGVLLVPAPPSAEMLHEHANICELQYPLRGNNPMVRWMRLVASYME